MGGVAPTGLEKKGVPPVFGRAHQRWHGHVAGRHGLERVSGKHPELDMLHATADDSPVAERTYACIKDLQPKSSDGGGGKGLCKREMG